MKTEHQEVPKTHFFSDGDKVVYWRGKNGLVYGQLVNAKGKTVRQKFTYLGDTP